MDEFLYWLLAALGLGILVAWGGHYRRRQAMAQRQAAAERALADERAEAQRLAEAEHQAAVQRASDAEAVRLAAAQAEAELRLAAQAEAERVAAAQAAADQAAAVRAELERVAAERLAAEHAQAEAERASAARLQAERAAAAQVERERIDAARAEAQRVHAEQVAAAAAIAERERVEEAARAAAATLAAAQTRVDVERAAADRARLEREAVAARPAPKSAQQTLVMVADDSKVVRIKTGRLLGQHHYQVCFAVDGTQAAQQLLAGMPDVLITDVEMPGMDGFELTRHIRGNPLTAHIPVIMITAADDRHREQAELAGVSVLLGKPYAEDALIAHIRLAMGHDGPSPRAAVASTHGALDALV